MVGAKVTAGLQHSGQMSDGTIQISHTTPLSLVARQARAACVQPATGRVGQALQ